MIPRHLRRATDYLLAIPIHVKVLGIVSVALVGMGSMTVLLACHAYGTGMAASMARFSKEKTASLAVRTERLLITGDTLALTDLLRREHSSNPDLRYAVVYDAVGNVAAHGFPDGLPEALAKATHHASQRTFLHRGELIFDTWVPVLGGRAGSVRVGIGARVIERQVESLGRRLWLALGICLAVALVIAGVVTRMMTRSLRRLVTASERLGSGDLGFRAPSSARDEVGDLTLSFNDMADRLERQRAELDQRERERAALHERILHLQEEERRRIAQDLHDDLGSSLAAMLVHVQERRRKLVADLRETQGGALDDWSRMEAQITRLLRRVRWLARHLRPSELDEGGLGPAIAQLVGELHDELGVTLDYFGDCGEDEPPPLPVAVELALYRIAQEAVSNALRHAEASRISVVFMQRAQEVSLVVEDDGRGFALGKEEGRPDQLGLAGMRERVDALGGSLYIYSEPGQGTIVRAVVPLASVAPTPPPPAGARLARRQAAPGVLAHPFFAADRQEPATLAPRGEALRQCTSPGKSPSASGRPTGWKEG